MDCLTLVQAMYLPPFDYVLLGICGDDTLRVWGLGVPHSDSSSDNDHDNNNETTFTRRFDVVAMRDLFLKRRKAQLVQVSLNRSSSPEVAIAALKKDFSRGHLTAVACSPDTKHVLVATLDSTLVLFATNDGEFSVERVLRLANAVYLTKINFLFSELLLLLCRTNSGDLLLLDLTEPTREGKEMGGGGGVSSSSAQPQAPPPPVLLLAEENCVDFVCAAANSKLVAVQGSLGEIDWFSVEYLGRRMEKEVAKRNALRLGTAAAKKVKVPASDLENVQREVSFCVSVQAEYF